MGHSRQASATTFPHVSLFMKGDDSAKRVPVRCFSDGRILGLLLPLPPAVLTGFPREQTFRGSGFWPNCLSQCCVRQISLTVTKQLDSCSTFHKADVTSRALSSHFVSWF